MGGALQETLLPTLMGAGGPAGGGRQYYSWISMDDQIYATYHLMMTPSCEGVYNLTAPEPVTKSSTPSPWQGVAAPCFRSCSRFCAQIDVW